MIFDSACILGPLRAGRMQQDDLRGPCLPGVAGGYRGGSDSGFPALERIHVSQFQEPRQFSPRAPRLIEQQRIGQVGWRQAIPSSGRESIFRARPRARRRERRLRPPRHVRRLTAPRAAAGTQGRRRSSCSASSRTSALRRGRRSRPAHSDTHRRARFRALGRRDEQKAAIGPGKKLAVEQVRCDCFRKPYVAFLHDDRRECGPICARSASTAR